MKQIIVIVFMTMIFLIGCAVQPELPDRADAVPINIPEVSVPEVDGPEMDAIEQPIAPELNALENVDWSKYSDGERADIERWANGCRNGALNLCKTLENKFGIIVQVGEKKIWVDPGAEDGFDDPVPKTEISVTVEETVEVLGPVATQSWDLKVGANIITPNVAPGWNAKDLFDNAKCVPEKVSGNHMIKSFDGFSQTDRKEYMKGDAGNVFTVGPGDLYLVYCKEKGTITMTGPTKTSFKLNRDTNFVTTPPGKSLTGTQLEAGNTCKPTSYYYNFISVNDDGRLKQTSKEEYFPKTQNGERFVAGPSTLLLIKCIKDGGIVFS